MPLAYLCAGCGKLRSKPGRCSACMRPANKKKNQRTNARTVYQTVRWRNLRARVLAQEPDCMVCGRPANTVDHIEPFEGAADPLAWDESNLQALCAVHHGQKDAKRRYA